MSAALKQRASASVPTPFASPERGRLAHAIAAAADAGARLAALEKAAQTANADVMRAISAAEAAEAAIETARANAVRHLTAVARGTAGAVPQTVREARAAAIEAQDHLEECRQTREALKAELGAADTGLSALRINDAAKAVIRAEMRERAVDLAARVAKMQRELVAHGSGLEWLSRAGVFPERNGLPADENIRYTVLRMESGPKQWAIGAVRYAESFAEPSGSIAWDAALKALCQDATAALPEED